jgi:hypothetical protein
MKNRQVILMVGAIFCAIGNLAGAAGKMDVGREEYRENCLNCHGDAGEGNGPYVSLLKKKPSDLTVLSKSNNGVFPFSRVYEFIDGREMVSSHGQREMPIWGNAYRVVAGEHYVDVPYSPEVFVRSRILALIEYISRLQKN